MAIQEEKVTVATCNGCGKKRYAENGTPIVGISGTTRHVILHEEDGKPLVRETDYFSCSLAPGHVGKAIRNALDEQLWESAAPIQADAEYA
jgi:hypothetical protein